MISMGTRQPHLLDRSKRHLESRWGETSRLTDDDIGPRDLGRAMLGAC